MTEFILIVWGDMVLSQKIGILTSSLRLAENELLEIGVNVKYQLNNLSIPRRMLLYIFCKNLLPVCSSRVPASIYV